MTNSEICPTPRAPRPHFVGLRSSRATKIQSNSSSRCPSGGRTVLREGELARSRKTIGAGWWDVPRQIELILALTITDTDEMGSQGWTGGCKQKDEPNGKQFGPSLVGVFRL